MATLAFEVQADYDKVIKLREEILRLEKALDSMQGNGSKDAITELEDQLSSARKEMQDTIVQASKLGQELESTFKDSAKVSQELDLSKSSSQITALSYAIHENEQAMAQGSENLKKWKQDAEAALKAGDTGTLEAITADIKQQVQELQELSAQTESYRQAQQALINGGGQMDTSLNGIRDTLSKIGSSCEAQEREINNLKQEYQRLAVELDRNVAEGSKEEASIRKRMQIIQGEVAVRQGLLNELRSGSNELEREASKMEQNAAQTQDLSNKHESLRAQIKALKQEMAELRIQGVDEQSEAYKRLAEELGRLQDIQGDISRQGQILSNDERAIAGVTSGLQGLTGGFTAAQNAIAMFTGSNEALQLVMSKTYALMAVTNGIQQVATMLNKDSAFRLVTMAKAREQWNKLLAIGRGEQIADTAATVADTVAQEANNVAKETSVSANTQSATATSADTAAKNVNTIATTASTTASIGFAGALRMVGAAIKGLVSSIPVFGWILAAVTALAGGIALLTKKTREAKKKSEEMYKAMAEGVYQPIGAVEQLSTAWTRLGDDLKAKEKFIEENKTQFDSLGVSINSVSDAERLLISNKDDFINAQIAKAKATVILNQAMEGLKEVAKIDAEIADVEKNGRTTRRGYVTEDITEKTLERLKAQRDELMKPIQEAYQQAAAAEEEGAEIMKKAGVGAAMVVEGSLNDLNAKIQKSQSQLANMVIDSKEYKEKQKEIDELQKSLEKAQGKSGAGTSSAGTDKQAKKEADRTREVEEKQQKEELRAIKDREFARRQAEIDVMQEGNQKTIKQIELDYEKQKEAILRAEDELKQAKIDKARERFEANPQNQGREFDKNSVDVSLSQEELAYFTAQEKKIEAEHARSLEAIHETEREALSGFLKEYGTYEEQRRAITEEYAEKIAKAQTLGEKMALETRRDKELQTLSFKFEDDTSWEAIFTNIDKYSVDYLKELQEKIKEMLSSDDITAEQAETLGKQLGKINSLILDKGKSWAEVFGLISERQRELNQLISEQKEAEESLQDAQRRYNDSLADTERIQAELSERLQEIGLTDFTIDNISVENAPEIMTAAQESGASEEVLGGIEELIVSLGKSEARTAENAVAVKKNETALKAATKAVEGASKRTKEERAASAIDTAQQISDALKDMGTLTDMLGFDENVGKTFNTLSQSVNSSIDAFKDFTSGNYVGAAVDAFSAVGSFGQALGLWGGDSDKTLLEDIERMTAQNADLTRAIDNLSEIMSENTTSLSEASDLYSEQIDDLNNAIANTQEMMERSGAAYGSHHSSNYRIDKGMSASDWEKISEAAGTTVASASDFWELTAEQMWNVQTHASSYYSKLKDLADDGYRDAAQFMDEYCDYWQQLQDLEDEYAEKLTNTSFDSLVDSFKSALMDMNHSAADWADDFENLMKEAMITSMMTETYNTRLEQWYNDFRNAMESDSTLKPEEQEELKNSYMRIVDDATQELESLYAIMGWSKSGYSQSGSQGGFNSMSEDTAQELNGRFTALQEAGYGILDSTLEGGENLRVLLGSIDLGNSRMASIEAIGSEARQILSSSFLELQEIADNTQKSLTQLLLLSQYMKAVRDNTAQL